MLAQLFLYRESLRVDIDAFLRSLGIEPETVRAPDVYIPIATYLCIQGGAAAYVNDPYFCLHVGEFARPGSWSILGCLMMNCQTLNAAFEKAGRYQRVIGYIITTRVEVGFGKARVIYFTPPHAPQMSRHCFDAAFSSTVRLARTLSDRPLNPLEVTFIYPEPDSRAEYERIFNCPVRFDSKDNSMTLDMRWGSLPVRMANPSLLEHFERYARDFLAQMERKDATTQVTCLLGFSEPSVFRKAFKKWSGVTPRQYRLGASGMTVTV